MAADEQQRRVHFDLVALKDLQTIVLDLEELQKLHIIAKRPRVRSILSREIANLESKIVSNCTDSYEKIPEEEDCGNVNVNLAETSSKRKRKGRGQPESSMMKKPKLSAIKKPLVVSGSSCQNIEEEHHGQHNRSSEQVLQENANISDVNEACPTAVILTKNTDISNKMSQISRSDVVKFAAGSGHGPSQSRQRTWCRFCEKFNHTESECHRRNGTCFRCHETGHIAKNCPKAHQRSVTSCESTQEQLSQQSLPTKTSNQVSRKKTSPTGVNETSQNSPTGINEASVLTTVATESGDVSNETSQTMPSPATATGPKFKLGSSQKRKICHTYVKSECFRCSDTCFNCHETGHMMADCPNLPKYAVSYCAKIPITACSSCKSTQEEPNQQPLPTGNSEQVIWEKTNPSDLNEASPMAVISAKNADISDKMSQITRSAVVISASGSDHGPSQSRQKSSCRLCEKGNHTESECYRRNTICFKCHEKGHILMNCPKAHHDAISPGRMRSVTAGSSCESTQERLSQLSLPTKTSDQVSLKKTSPTSVNEASVLTTVATQNGDVSNETSQTMLSPATVTGPKLKLGSSRKRKICHTCVKSECFRCSGTCFYCHETGHMMADCPNLPKYAGSSCGKIPVTAYSSCKSTQEEPNQEFLPTRASEEVLLDKATSSDVNELATKALAGTESADVAKGKPNMCTIKEPIVIIGSSSKSTQEEPNQQPLPTGTSEQVIWEKTNPSDLNEASPMAVISTKNADIPSDRRSQITRSSVVISASGSDHGPSQSRQKSLCRVCEKGNHTESECYRRNGTCFKCHEKGHIIKNCPKANRDAISSSRMRSVTTGRSCESTQEERSQQSLPTKTSDQVSLKKTSPSDVNEASTENASVSNETSQTANCPKKIAQDATNPSGVKTSSVTNTKVKKKVPADAECLHCKGKGHWKRSCPKYLADLKSGKVLKPSVPADAECLHCEGKGYWKRSCPKYLADLKSGKVLKRSDTLGDGGS